MALLNEADQIIKAYDAAMACQGPHAHDAKLIVMANYGDLAIGILRAILKNPAASLSAGK